MRRSLLTALALGAVAAVATAPSSLAQLAGGMWTPAQALGMVAACGLVVFAGTLVVYRGLIGDDR